jgi:hypothetical protein
MHEIELRDKFLFYTSDNNETSIHVIVEDDTVWVTQKSMAEIFDTTKQNISKHLVNIFQDGELSENSVVNEKLTTAIDGKKYNTQFFNLDVIISVGYRVNSYKATQFRIWATNTLKEYMIKGFALDDERLKQGNNLFGKDYFDELLERIREIRASERRFYQKVTDLYALSSDYDKNAPASQEFFSTVKNKLHWAITGKTAAELIHAKADATSPNMGLLTWSNAPDGKVVKTDTHVAKNYLEEADIKELESLVSAYLELAENRAKRRILMKMSDWIKFLNNFLQLSEYPILKNKGKISHAKAVLKADKEYKVFRVQQDKEYISDFDKAVEHIKTHGQLPKSEHIRLEKKITNFDKKLEKALAFNPKD